MKTLNSWVVALIASSAFVTQANAGIMLAEPQIASPVQQSELPAGFENRGDNSIDADYARPVFVPGSLIDNSGTTTWLMAESVRGKSSGHPESVVVNGSVGRLAALTPIPPAGDQLRPISTFAQFTQNFKSTPQNQDHADAVQVLMSHTSASMTSSLFLTGLFAMSLAGIGASVSAARRGLFFGRTYQQHCARLY